MGLVYKTVKDGEGNETIAMDEKGFPVVYDDELENSEPLGLDAIHLYKKVPELSLESKNKKEKIFV